MNPRPARQRPAKPLKAKADGQPAAPPAPAPSATTGTTGRRTSRTPRPRAGSSDLPRYQQTVRIDGKLWPDQLSELTELRRKVAAARTDKSERITDNTLLRVAVDLLLAHRDRLVGDNEDQLRASVLSPKTR